MKANICSGNHLKMLINFKMTMNRLTHTSAKASHYNKDAGHYDGLNEKTFQTINVVIENILKKYGVNTVLDMACGTGSQILVG